MHLHRHSSPMRRGKRGAPPHQNPTTDLIQRSLCEYAANSHADTWQQLRTLAAQGHEQATSIVNFVLVTVEAVQKREGIMPRPSADRLAGLFAHDG